SHLVGSFPAYLYPRFKKRPLAKIDSIFRDAFHRIAISGRIRTGQKTKRPHVDAEDWLYALAEMPNDVQTCSVAADHYSKIRRGYQLADRMVRFLAGDRSSLLS